MAGVFTKDQNHAGKFIKENKSLANTSPVSSAFVETPKPPIFNKKNIIIAAVIIAAIVAAAAIATVFIAFGPAAVFSSIAVAATVALPVAFIAATITLLVMLECLAGGVCDNNRGGSNAPAAVLAYHPAAMANGSTPNYYALASVAEQSAAENTSTAPSHRPSI